MNKTYFNIENFRQFFIKTVRDINTSFNLNWKLNCVNEIYFHLDRYLLNEKFYNNLLYYEFKVERIGQSTIYLTLNYKETFYSEIVCIEFSERLKTPKEATQSVLLAFEYAIISNSAQVSGIMKDS
jgi:hypothetical protein